MNKDQTSQMPTNTFGVPIPDNTPVGQLRMQGKMIHGIATHPHGRSMLVRILAILFCLVCLIGPGAFFLVVAMLAYTEGGFMALIIPVTLGLIFIGGGISGIVANVKKSVKV